MSTLIANNATLTYTTTVANNDGPFTITITNFAKGSTWQTTESRRIYLKLNGVKVVEVIGENPPSVSESLRGGSASSTGGATGGAKRITKDDIAKAKTQRETALQQSISDAYTMFISKFNALKTNGSITRSVNRTDEDQQYRLEIYVFGAGAQATFNIPKRSQSSTPTPHEETKVIGIDSVNNGKNYLINTNYYAKYGHIEKVVDFSEVEDAAQLKSLADEYIKSNQFDDLSLSVSAIDLHKKGDNASPSAFNLMDQVRCISEPHGLNRYFPITEMTIPLDHPEQTTYTLGKSGLSTMSSTSSDNASGIFRKINKMPTVGEGLTIARGEMSLMLDRRTKGYVNIVQENDISQALVISDTPDWTNAHRFWKFNMNGLGFTSETVDQLSEDKKQALRDAHIGIQDSDHFYKIGMTMNGEIVANMITVGTITDGKNYNFWNLQTGAFQLRPTTTSIPYAGKNTKEKGFSTVSSLINALITNVDNTETANTNALIANQKAANADKKATNADIKATNNAKEVKALKTVSSGVTNLLRGTNVIKIESNGSYSRSSFRNSGKGNGKRTLKNAENPPVSSIKKQLAIAKSTNGKNPTSINQPGVPLQPSTTYVVSCYAKSSAANGKLFLSVGSTVNGTWCGTSKTIKIPKANVWKQFSMIFTTGENNSKSYVNRAGLVNNKTNVQFGNSGTTTVTICGMKVEKGNRSSDYATSSDDTNYYIKEWWATAEPAIAQKDKRYTDAQVAGLKQLKTAEGILKRLTGNNAHAGIYLDKGHLYINADYIRSGGLKAGLLQTGIIHDGHGVLNRATNLWNLTKGYLQTSNIKLVNGEITGRIECLKYNKTIKTMLDSGMNISSGALNFFDRKRQVKASIAVDVSTSYPALKFVSREVNIVADTISQHGVAGFTGTIKFMGGYCSFRNGILMHTTCPNRAHGAHGYYGNIIRF